ncbi:MULTISPECIES: hypothetical protein [unclassified Treponema]|uniref:hypothetical protein n=1 Tax=unclassified Treponema TaxID=2638727 RepID=UPI0020A25929|nr:MULTISPECIES: hypothetical protein [unclassified Treponema]
MDFLKDFDKSDFESISYFIPLLMIKDFNMKGELRVNNSFMTLADIPFLTVKGLDEKLQKNPFTGIFFKDSQCKSPAKIMTGGDWQAYYQLEMTKFKDSEGKWAFVKDNVYDPNNWSKTNFNKE